MMETAAHRDVDRASDTRRGGDEHYYFGPFRLDPRKGTLYRDGVPLRVVARSIDLLLVLLESAGMLVASSRLATAAGGGGPSSLRVYMSALRRTLGAGADGSDYFLNEHGRGYVFVAQVKRSLSRLPTLGDPDARPSGQMARLVGRDEVMATLCKALAERRFVSVVGPGGIGKSSVAAAFVEEFAGQYADKAFFFDLTLIDDARSLPNYVARQLGLPPAIGTGPDAIGSALAEQKILLVFDNCEPMLAGVAKLAETLLSMAPGVHVLATSREALRATGEKVIRLPALDCPSDPTASSPETAIGFSAIQLFVERARANSADFGLTDENTRMVAEICRRLDGLPLAIELAAAWVAFFGVDGLARELDSHFLAARTGRRSALPRHQTLVAMLDWSYDALTDKERLAFDRLSVFRASFTLDSAIAVVADEEYGDRDVASALARLVGKSLVSVEMNHRSPEYRMLETTRSYAARKFAASGGQREVRRRHAARCLGLLGRADLDLVRFGRKSWVGLYGGLVADTLIALDWAFSDTGDIELGVALTAASAVFGEQFQLHQEYHDRIRMALDRTSAPGSGDAAVEHELRLTLGHLLELKGEEETAYLLAVSRRHEAGGPRWEMSPKDLARRWSATWVSGRYPEARDIAEALGVLGDQLGDAEIKMVANRIMAQSLHCLGRNAEAKRLAQKVLDGPFVYLPFTNITHQISMRIVLARIAFLEGDASAADRVNELMALGESDNPVALCQIMGTAAIPIALWSEDIDRASAMTGRLAALGSTSAMGFWNVFSEQLRIAVGLRSGSMRVRPARAMGFNGEPIHPMVTDLTATLDGRLLIPATVARVDEGLVGWCAPEIMRLDARAQDSVDRARRLQQALSVARSSNAGFWERRIREDLGQDIGPPAPLRIVER